MRTDTQRIDGLQKLLGRYTGRVICRWSTCGRGWRLHEHSGNKAVADVRTAIDSFLDDELKLLEKSGSEK